MRRLATMSAVLIAFSPAAAYAQWGPKGLGVGGPPAGVLSRITQGSSADRYDFGPGYDGSDGVPGRFMMRGNPMRNDRLTNEPVVNRPVADARS